MAGKRGSSPAGSIEDLKKAGAAAAEGFNRGGNAAGNLLTSADASQAIPGGSGPGGAGGSAGDGKEDKSGGANKDMHSNSKGEPSLDYLMRKEEMQREMDLKWQKKTKEEMFPLEMKQEIQKTFMMDGLVKPIAGGVGDAIKEGIGGLFGRDKSETIWVCSDPKWGPRSGDIAECGKGGKEGEPQFCRLTVGGVTEIRSAGQKVGGNCWKKGGSDDAAKKENAESTADVPADPAGMAQITGEDGKPVSVDAFGLCNKLGTASKGEFSGIKESATKAEVKALLEKYQQAAQLLVGVNDALAKSEGTQGSDSCTPEPIAAANAVEHAKGKNVVSYQRLIASSLANEGSAEGGLGFLDRTENAMLKVNAGALAAKTKVEAYSGEIRGKLAEEGYVGAAAVTKAGKKGATDPEKILETELANALKDAAEQEKEAEPKLKKAKEALGVDKDTLSEIGKNIGKAMTLAGLDKKEPAEIKDIDGPTKTSIKEHFTALQGMYEKLKTSHEALNGTHGKFEQQVGFSETVQANMKDAVIKNLEAVKGNGNVELVAAQNVNGVAATPPAPKGGAMSLGGYYAAVNGDPAAKAPRFEEALRVTGVGFSAIAEGGIMGVKLPDVIPPAPGKVFAKEKDAGLGEMKWPAPNETNTDVAKAEVKAARDAFEPASTNAIETLVFVRDQAKGANDNGVHVQATKLKELVAQAKKELESAAAGKPAAK
ncbi:MAG: hypothetical protein WC943_07610 [Elusimicrobiota bacterium]